MRKRQVGTHPQAAESPLSDEQDSWLPSPLGRFGHRGEKASADCRFGVSCDADVMCNALLKYDNVFSKQLLSDFYFSSIKQLPEPALHLLLLQSQQYLLL